MNIYSWLYYWITSSGSPSSLQRSAVTTTGSRSAVLSCRCWLSVLHSRPGRKAADWAAQRPSLLYRLPSSSTRYTCSAV